MIMGAVCTRRFSFCDVALEHLSQHPCDVFNHNLKTIPRLYKKSCPGADYNWSLTLLKRHKEAMPNIPTKSGLCLAWENK